MCALFIVIIGLGLGFASFSNNLSISYGVNVKPNSDTFNVDFSSSSTEVKTSSITAVTSGGATATPATIDNTADPTITGLSANFTKPGQSVEYTFYAANIGEYEAFLNSIIFANAEGGTSFKLCTANTGTADTLVQTACDDITVKVKVGSEVAVESSVTNISNHPLAKKAFEKIIVTIEYASDGDRADGDFSVKFGDISLSYSSVKSSAPVTYSVTCYALGVECNDYQKFVNEGETYTVSTVNLEVLNITMGGKKLSSDDYIFDGNNLSIPNVNGDLIISLDMAVIPFETGY